MIAENTGKTNGRAKNTAKRFLDTPKVSKRLDRIAGWKFNMHISKIAKNSSFKILEFFISFEIVPFYRDSVSMLSLRSESRLFESCSLFSKSAPSWFEVSDFCDSISMRLLSLSYSALSSMFPGIRMKLSGVATKNTIPYTM